MDVKTYGDLNRHQYKIEKLPVKWEVFEVGMYFFTVTRVHENYGEIAKLSVTYEGQEPESITLLFSEREQAQRVADVLNGIA